MRADYDSPWKTMLTWVLWLDPDLEEQFEEALEAFEKERKME